MNLIKKDILQENSSKQKLSKMFPAIDSYNHLKKYTDTNNVPAFSLIKYIDTFNNRKKKIYYLTKNSNNYGIYLNNNNKYIPPFMKHKNNDFFLFYKKPKLNLDLLVNKFILKNAPYINKNEFLIKNFKIFKKQFSLTQNRIHSSFERNNYKESNNMNNTPSNENKQTKKKLIIKKPNSNLYTKEPFVNTYQPQLENDFIYDENNNAEFHFKSIRFFIGNRDPSSHHHLHHNTYYINEKRKHCKSASRINVNTPVTKNIYIDSKTNNKRNISGNNIFSPTKKFQNEEITDTTENINMSKSKKGSSTQKILNNNETKNINDYKKIFKKNNECKKINDCKKEKEDIRFYKTAKNGFKNTKHNKTSTQFFINNQYNQYISKRRENNNDDIIKLI